MLLSALGFEAVLPAVVVVEGGAEELVATGAADDVAVCEATGAALGPPVGCGAIAAEGTLVTDGSCTSLVVWLGGHAVSAPDASMAISGPVPTRPDDVAQNGQLLSAART